MPSIYKSTLLVLLIFTVKFLNAQDFWITRDTIVNNTWKLPSGSILHFGSKGKISGRGSIQGGIIDAAPQQWIFDTSITINPEGTYSRFFSARWFGAGKFNDNWYSLQKSIQTVLQNSGSLRDLFIPKGDYAYSRPLLIAQQRGKSYMACSIHLFGEASFWDMGNGTNLLFTGISDYALGIQKGKGVEIDHITLKGVFMAPAYTGPSYYQLPLEQFIHPGSPDVSSGYSGLVIDPIAVSGDGGSTGIYVHDVQASQFSIDFSVSPNAQTFNADILQFERIKCGDARVGFATGQAQEKGNMIRGIYAWGNLHTLYRCGYYGKKQAGQYVIDGGNIAGRCIRLFDIRQDGWYNTTIHHLFAESIYEVGSLSSGIPMSLNNCTFHFALPAQAGNRTVLQVTGSQVVFNNCIFRYYGTNTPIKITGNPVFNQCSFGGSAVEKLR